MGSSSIHEHIQAHLDPDRPGLTENGESLPDEERIAGKHQIRWAAGAMDGVTSPPAEQPSPSTESEQGTGYRLLPLAVLAGLARARVP